MPRRQGGLRRTTGSWIEVTPTPASLRRDGGERNQQSQVREGVRAGCGVLEHAREGCAPGLADVN